MHCQSTPNPLSWLTDVFLSAISTRDDVLFERQALISHQLVWNSQLQKSGGILQQQNTVSTTSEDGDN